MKRKIVIAVAVAGLFVQSSAFAGKAEAEKWVNDEFQPSTLSKSEQMEEMAWFIKAAEPFKGHGNQRALGNYSDP
jgi:glycerol transport system substrate-binding protein